MEVNGYLVVFICPGYRKVLEYKVIYVSRKKLLMLKNGWYSKNGVEFKNSFYIKQNIFRVTSPGSKGMKYSYFNSYDEWLSV